MQNILIPVVIQGQFQNFYRFIFYPLIQNPRNIIFNRNLLYVIFLFIFKRIEIFNLFNHMIYTCVYIKKSST